MVVLADFAGKYKLEKSEKFEEFMCALGVNYLLRKVGNQTYPELTSVVDGEHLVLTSSSTFKTTVLDFNIGKEFITETPDGRKVKAVVTFEDDKLIQKERPVEEGAGDEKNTTYIRELDADKNILMTCKIANIVCTRLYKRK